MAAFKFRRQESIGKHIVDFVCFSNKLIVELDGGQHAEKPGRKKDVERTRDLEGRGFRLLRFWNDEVLKEGAVVVSEVYRHLRTPLTLPSPTQGGRGKIKRQLCPH
jgi:very-short-patch-repair endonuclease